MSRNTGLHSAKRARNDEFYTRMDDIERELPHYRDHFRNKTIYCNCDDPKVSNFYHYFSMQFHNLGLRKLIASCYRNRSADLFGMHDRDRAIWLEYNGETRGNRPVEPEINHFRGDGDFRNEENIELLKQADIVVTNPPFSLFREYVAQLMKYDRKFIILGNMNAVTYKEIFPLIRDNRMWYGPSISGGGLYFRVPDNLDVTSKSLRTGADGRKYVEIDGVRWFTNLHHYKRNERLPMRKKYNPQDYPKYDNYDAIEVGSRNDIPVDYPGVMGVPIRFLDKYNPEQFDLIWVSDRGGDGMLEDMKKAHHTHDTPLLDNRRVYKRIFIRARNRRNSI